MIQNRLKGGVSLQGEKDNKRYNIFPTPMKTTLQPDVLQWARKRAGLSIAEVAEKFGTSEERVIAWEGDGELTFAQAEKLADLTHTPFGYLFLRKRPEEMLPVPDFRTVGTQKISQPSPDLLDVVNDALRRQDWYRDYSLSIGDKSLAFVGSLKGAPDTVDAASLIRATVKWDASLRAQTSNWEQALTKQVESVEEIGILVMRSGIVGNNTRRPLSVSEFRGFALSDEYAPLIFLNSKDTKAAQIFTLAHELVHVWLGLSGISNLNKTYSPDNQTERFCNAVAAELLVPLNELQTQWGEVSGSSDFVKRLCRYFKVSSLVILRRLRDAEFLSQDEFDRLYSDELASGKSRSGGGGNFYRTLRTRLGRRFVSAMIESTLEGRTLYRDAFHLLGVSNAGMVKRLAQEVGAAA